MNVMGCNKANNNVKRDYFKSRKNCERSFWRRKSWRIIFFDSNPYSENCVQQKWYRWLLRNSYQICIWSTNVSSWIAKIVLSQIIFYLKISSLPFHTLLLGAHVLIAPNWLMTVVVLCQCLHILIFTKINFHEVKQWHLTKINFHDWSIFDFLAWVFIRKFRTLNSKIWW